MLAVSPTSTELGKLLLNGVSWAANKTIGIRIAGSTQSLTDGIVSGIAALVRRGISIWKRAANSQPAFAALSCKAW